MVVAVITGSGAQHQLGLGRRNQRERAELGIKRFRWETTPLKHRQTAGEVMQQLTVVYSSSTRRRPFVSPRNIGKGDC